MMEVVALNRLRKRSGRARPTRESLKSFMPKRYLASSSRENNRDSNILKDKIIAELIIINDSFF
jgi:hypothetical protein